MKEKKQVLIGTVVIVIAVISAILFFTFERERRLQVQEASFKPPDVETKALEQRNLEEIEMELFFFDGEQAAAGQDFLKAQKRKVYKTEDAVLMARQILAAIFKGDEKGLSLFPEEAHLRQFYLLDGVAVVDLTRETADGLAGGITVELAAIHSITRSLRRNIPEIREVRFLVEGQERDTLSGHVSIMRPFM